MSSILNPMTLLTMGAHNNSNWTSMPAAATFLTGAAAQAVVRPMSLAGYAQVRYMITMGATAGFAGSKVYLRYRTTYSATASDYVQLGASAEVECSIAAGTTIVDSGWLDLATGAKADVLIVTLGSGGNGAISPNIGQGTMFFR